MKKWFRPDLNFHEIAQVTPELLLENRIRFVLIDLDNTLADYDTPEPTEAIISWFLSMKNAGIKIAILSNNGEKRVSRFCSQLDIPFFWKSGKPRRSGARRAMQALSAVKEETALIGDKYLTDVLCARRCGIFSIKVDSIKPRWKI